MKKWTYEEAMKSPDTVIEWLDSEEGQEVFNKCMILLVDKPPGAMCAIAVCARAISCLLVAMRQHNDDRHFAAALAVTELWVRVINDERN